MGRLEPPCAITHRTGKRTSNVTEQFAFQQTFAKGAAIDLNERPGMTLTQLMNRRSDQLLARAGFAKKQYRCIAWRDTTGDAIHLLHGRAIPD